MTTTTAFALFDTGKIQLAMSGRRASVAERLCQRDWFNNSSVDIQYELLCLAEDVDRKRDWTGFLEFLADRSEIIAGVTTVELLALKRGNFGVIPVFKVVSPKGQEYTYEFFAWKFGAMSGAKGIVWIRNDVGAVTHFCGLRGEKFGPGKMCFDSFGGFIDPNTDGVTTVDERFVKEIREESGVSDLQIDEVVNLGTLIPDSGQGPNEPMQFAAFINASQTLRMTESPTNPDWRELKAGVYILPIEELGNHLRVNNDGFFRSAVALSVANGYVLPHYMVATAA